MRLASLTPSELTHAQRDLYELIAGGKRASGKQHFALKDERGALVGPFGVMLHEPAIGRPLQELGSAIRFSADLSDRVREIAILAVAAVTDSSFERYAHERVGHAVGLSRAELDALSDGTFKGADLFERTVHDFCRALAAGSAALDDVTFGETRELLGEGVMIDLVVLVGYYVTLAHLLQLFDVPTPTD